MRAGRERRGTPIDLLVIGLGNPGEEFARSRHNVGYEVVTELARRHGARLKKSREQALTTEVNQDGRRLALAMPTTFVNLSGDAASGLVRRYGITDPERIVVVHDELDLPPGVVRIKDGGGLAGHNGLRSITAHIGNDYRRVRLGIGHPGIKELVHSHVLSDFAKSDRAWVEALCEAVADNAGLLATGRDSTFANKVHLAMQAKGFFEDKEDEGGKPA